MSSPWLILLAGVLIIGFTLVQSLGEKLVKRLTGRDIRPPSRGTARYELVYFGIAFGTVFPAIFLFPEAHWLVQCAILFLCLTLGSLAAQALCGGKSDDATPPADAK